MIVTRVGSGYPRCDRPGSSSPSASAEVAQPSTRRGRWLSLPAIASTSSGNQTSYPATAALPGNTAAASPATSAQYDIANHSTIVTSAGTPVTMTYLNPDQNQRITAGGTYYGTGVLGVSYQTTNAATTAFTRTPAGSLVSTRTGSGSLYYLNDN